MENCPSCQFEFGVTDDNKGISYEEWRNQWVSEGMPWRSSSISSPIEWNPENQLQNILGDSQATFLSPKEVVSGLGAQVWIGIPPVEYLNSNTIVDFAADIVEVMHPFGIDFVVADNSHRFELESGRNAKLMDAIAGKSLSSLEFVSAGISHGLGYAYANITFGRSQDIAQASHVRLMLQVEDLSMNGSLIDRLIASTKRWFMDLHGAAAAIAFNVCATRSEQLLLMTQRERQHGRLREWQAVRQFARGCFWGNALGADLCKSLGGRDRVLREAPVLISEPLDAGVWLQLSAFPPANLSHLEILNKYMEPLLSWTLSDITVSSESTDNFVERNA